MSNIAICYDDRSQGGTYSGGLWYAGLPLSNLKLYDPKHLARSQNDSESSTQFVLDMGYPAPIEALGFVNHNLTDAAEVRWRVGPNADGSAALIDVTKTAGDFGSERPSSGKVLFHLNATKVRGRYIKVEVSDESNPKGYVQFGRHFAGPVFQPELNMVAGAQILIIDPSRLSRVVSGAQYADRKPKLRQISGAFDALSDDEAFGEVYNLQKMCGLDVPLFAVRDPSLTGDELQRTTIYGRLAALDEIEIAQAVAGGNRSSWSFVIEERN